MSPIYIGGKIKKKEPDRRLENRLRLAVSRFKVLVWSRVSNDNTTHEAFGFLADLSDTGVGLFIGESFDKGDAVYIAFDEAKTDPCRGIVMWSSRYSLEQHFIGHKALNFRMGLKFQFGSEADRQKFLLFYESMRSKLTMPEE